jgi:hypothetical protein
VRLEPPSRRADERTSARIRRSAFATMGGQAATSANPATSRVLRAWARNRTEPLCRATWGRVRARAGVTRAGVRHGAPRNVPLAGGPGPASRGAPAMLLARRPAPDGAASLLCLLAAPSDSATHGAVVQYPIPLEALSAGRVTSPHGGRTRGPAWPTHGRSRRGRTARRTRHAHPDVSPSTGHVRRGRCRPVAPPAAPVRHTRRTPGAHHGGSPRVRRPIVARACSERGPARSSSRRRCGFVCARGRTASPRAHAESRRHGARTGSRVTSRSVV